MFQGVDVSVHESSLDPPNITSFTSPCSLSDMNIFLAYPSNSGCCWRWGQTFAKGHFSDAQNNSFIQKQANRKCGGSRWCGSDMKSYRTGWQMKSSRWVHESYKSSEIITLIYQNVSVCEMNMEHDCKLYNI